MSATALVYFVLDFVNHECHDVKQSLPKSVPNTLWHEGVPHGPPRTPHESLIKLEAFPVSIILRGLSRREYNISSNAYHVFITFIMMIMRSALE